MVDQEQRQRVHLVASPAVALMDDHVQIQITGLSPWQPVTLSGRLMEGGTAYVAHAHYTAREDGTLDLGRDTAHGGSFRGCEPMGLFWSLSPEEGARRGLRLRKKDVMDPHQMTLSVLPGHVTVTRGSQHDEQSVLARADLERHYAWKDVVRIPVREGAMRGALFVPQGGVGRHPGLLDLYGSGGGLPEYRAAMLASRGFTTLALAYAGYDDLPDSLDLDFEYFMDALDWLNLHPNVIPDHLGIIGLSHGVEIAVQMSILSEKVRAVVGIGGMDIRVVDNQRYQGQEFTYAPFDYSKLEDTDDGLVIKHAYVSEEVRHTCEEAKLKVQMAKNTDFLFIAGSADLNNDCRGSLQLASRLIEHGHSNVALHLYQGAGHLIEPPYIPFCYASWHKLIGRNVVWGGQAKPHSRAQEDSWSKILAFFKEKLPVPETFEKLKSKI